MFELFKKIMPIGVPRIIYCWGEELPAQWTDIYNFIFRRRMVFLMQYLDDELCNQICGLLINIHMEDRSKEMEKKEIERSGVFKTNTKQSTKSGAKDKTTESAFYSKKQRSMEDLLNADEDLGIEQIDTLEQYTLQKITTDWLNWNAQFFDYSDEPYLYYLAELLSKDFNQNESRLNMGNKNPKEIEQLLQLLKNQSSNSSLNSSSFSSSLSTFSQSKGEGARNGSLSPFAFGEGGQVGNGLASIYSAFRKHAQISNSDYSFKDLNQASGKTKLLNMFYQYQNNVLNKDKLMSSNGKTMKQDNAIFHLLSDLSKKDFTKNWDMESFLTNTQGQDAFEKALSQRNLRRNYGLESNMMDIGSTTNFKSLSYLDSNISGQQEGYNEFRSYYRKQTERALIEEESKKVFVIINSFGGSVGNGVTVHDALQFIKAGSLTLGLGVAASAASLALAGGTIGERYVTEGCHVMIHQPEGGLQGQASDIWIDSQEIMKIRLDVAEIYSLSTYRPRHKILRDLDRDFYLTATETIYYGLADEIATNEVMHSIIEETNKVWDYHDSKQQRLLETRESASSGLDTQTQN